MSVKILRALPTMRVHECQVFLLRNFFPLPAHVLRENRTRTLWRTGQRNREDSYMRDLSRIGARCRTLYNVVTTKGLIRQDTYGIIREEMINFLGYPRLYVDWENGVSAEVPPYSVEVFRSEASHS